MMKNATVTTEIADEENSQHPTQEVLESADETPAAEDSEPQEGQNTQDFMTENTATESENLKDADDAEIPLPKADIAHITPAQAEEIQIPEAFLHAEYRKGSSAAITKMPILVTFEVGKKSIRLGDLEALQEGFVVECENLTQTPVNICANGQLIGKGSLLNIEGRIGVRVTELY